MARPKKSDTPDLSQRVNLTLGTIDRLKCPPDKQQVFLRDSEAPGLRVRVTAAGAKSFVYEAKLHRQTIRRTIGDVKLWTIEQARLEARNLAVMLDRGIDPRELERQQHTEKVAARAAEAARAVTVGEAWSAYIETRRANWSESHLNDHIRYSQAGGEAKKRGKGKTEPGPLHPLLSIPLREITVERVHAWAEKETSIRPTVTRNAWRLLRAFLTWCAEHPEYSTAAPSPNPAQSRKVKEAVGKPGVKKDSLQRSQLNAWFGSVKCLKNSTISAYLQVLLLTGARPNEVIKMKWEDVDFQWHSIKIRDKVEGDRVIPLTPYVRHLLETLPKHNTWIFASERRKDSHIHHPNKAHHKACNSVAIGRLTLHGLRRSFGTLSEWVNVPVGVAAQIQGHKPSATAEKHYRAREIEMLRMHHENIESWILETAEISF